MKHSTWFLALVMACKVEDPETPDPIDTVDTVDTIDQPEVGIGADGGSVSASGATVTVPAGALSDPVEITIVIQDPGVALPEGWEAAGEVFAVQPHGTTFDAPITVALPDAGLTAETGGVLVLSDPSDTTWEEVLPADWASGTVTVSTDHLSFWRAARRVVPAICDHASATAALAAVDVVLARSIYAGCVQSFPDDGAALFGHALTTLLTSDRWSAVASVLSWCHETADIEAALYGPGGFVAALRDSWDQVNHVTTAERISGAGVASSIAMLANPTVGTAWHGTWWTETGEEPRIAVKIYEDREQYTALYFQIPVGTTGAFVPTADQLHDINIWVDYDTWPTFATGEFYAESASFVVHQLGDEPGEAVEIDYDILFRDECRGGSCGALHYVGSVQDTLDRTAEDYTWPFDDRQSLSDTQPTVDASFLAELAFQCDVPDFASVYPVLDGIRAELDAVAAELERAAADPGLAFVFPKEALWFLNKPVVLGPTDATAVAAVVEAASASLRLAMIYRLVDETRTFDALTGQVTDIDWSYDYDTAFDSGGWDSASETSTCTSTVALGDDPTAIAEDLAAHALEIRDAAAAQAARDALTTLMGTLLDALDAQPTIGVFDPTAFQVQPLRDALRADVDALGQSLATTDRVAAPSSPAIDLMLGSFFASPPDRATLLGTLGIDALVGVAEGEDPCENTHIVFDEAFLDWAAHGARAADIPDRIVEEGFRPSEIPSFMDGDLWEGTANYDGWPYYLSEDLYQSIIGW